MKIKDAVNTALTKSHISDPLDVQQVQSPFEALRNNSPYIEFVDELSLPITFQADVAHVVTKVEGKPANQVRNMRRADGRTEFTVPSLTFEAPGELLLYKRQYRDEWFLDGATKSLPEVLGANYAALVHLHIISALLASAENQGKVIHTTELDLKNTVRNVVDGIEGPSSVLTNTKYSSRVSEVPWGDKVIGHEGHICQSMVLDENILIVVNDDPRNVGFVWVESAPEMYVSNGPPGIVLCSVLGECRICVWGNANVTKIDLRAKS